MEMFYSTSATVLILTKSPHRCRAQLHHLEVFLNQVNPEQQLSFAAAAAAAAAAAIPLRRQGQGAERDKIDLEMDRM